jgi:Mn-dependent DtxR family transcriptional regulator
MLFTNPMLDVGEVRKRFNVTYPTAKGDLERLAEPGVVEILKDYSPRTYVVTRIFDVAYQELEFSG